MRRIRPLPSLLLALACGCAAAATALALAQPAAAGHSDGSIPDAIAACEGGPYDYIERDGDIYVACHGPALAWMRFAAAVEVEGAVAHVTVTRSGAGSGRRALLRYRTIDGSAQAGRDYVAAFGALYFDDRETTRRFDVALLDDPAALEPRSLSIGFDDGAAQRLVLPAAQPVQLPFATPWGPAPAIAGSARDGQTLTAALAPWSPAADTVAWQWERCDADGGGCAPMAGATAATLTPSGLAGSRLRVTVTATNAAGTTTRSSDPTAVVRPPLTAPAVDAAPPATTTARDAVIAFSGEAGATFACQLDGGPWEACASPLRLTGLAPGERLVELRQTATDGVVSPLARVAWTVREEEAGEPGPGGPGSGEPEPGGPGSSEPGPGGPGSGEPEPGGPGSSEPGPGGPGGPGSGEPEPSEPGPGTPGPTTPQPGAPGPDGAGPGEAGAGAAPGRSRPRPHAPRTPRRGAGAKPRPAARAVVTTLTVRFCAGCARPSARDRTRLLQLRRRVRGARLLRVVGHADASGDRGDNLRLAQRRARLVARLLLPARDRGRRPSAPAPRSGAAPRPGTAPRPRTGPHPRTGPGPRTAPRPRRVEIRNAGTSRPVASNGTLAGRALNRRVTIRIVATQ